jgi:hypothetical protein
MKTRWWAIASMCVAAVSSAWAAEPAAQDTDPSEHALWINVGGFSSHFNRDKGYNENNVGAGVEYVLNEDISLMAGSYTNSVRQNTTYAAVNWQPLHWGEWRFGLAMGAMDGYPAIERGGTFFVALPLASYESKPWGVNVGLIPNMTNVDGAIIIQFKFRVR